MCCPECKTPLTVNLTPGDNGKTYHWCCRACGFRLDTGVASDLSVEGFDPQSGWAEHAQQGMPANVATVYMPIVLQHFIECDWRGCWEGVLDRIIRPHLHAPEILDLVLRSGVVRPRPDTFQAPNGALMFRELYDCLRTVPDAQIQRYLQSQFAGHWSADKDC
jgi:hypothetical protein